MIYGRVESVDGSGYMQWGDSVWDPGCRGDELEWSVLPGSELCLCDN